MGLLTDLKSSIARAASTLFSAEDPKRIGIYGPPNAGKCLAPDEKVLLADGTHRRIEDVFETVAATDPSDVSNEPHETWLECDADISVPALRSDLSADTVPVSHVFKQRYEGPLYRVRTRLGREVTVSPEHPFVAATPNGVENVRAGHLEEGDRIAHLASFEPTNEEWTKELPETLAADGGTLAYDSTHHRPKPVRDREFDPNVARFLALTITEAQHDKRIPESILTADDETVAAFLRAAFDCEGSVSPPEDDRGRYVRFSSASRELVVGVATLLLRFAIVGKICERARGDETYYELEIGRSDQHRRFRRHVGSDDPDKAARLDGLCECDSKANVHTLPLMPVLEDAREELGMTQAEFYGDNKHVARMRRKNSITIDRVEAMAEWLPDHEAAEPVHDLANADVAWDAVVEVETVHHEGYIYDLTVPDHHTFTTAEGLVVHNTTLANRITRDWTEHGDAIGPESHIPHETRRARRKENIEIERNGRTVTIDIVDTPGVTTKVDYTEFLEHDIEEDDAVRRSREATEGVAEAMHWLREDVDGVVYVLDSATDPFTQVNTMLIGIIESQDLPVLILANKIDLEEASVQRIRNAFPQHETVPVSALEGDNMDEVYDKIAEYFG